jgi:transcription antitermination factor NusG
MQEIQEYAFHDAWYGVRTRSNCEKLAAQVLQSKTYATYAQVYRARRRRSDRVVEIELPLFPGYVFCRLNLGERILPVLTSPGVVSLVGFGNQPAPIPDFEIDAIRRLLASGAGVEPYPFARIGQRVRVTQGSLSGLEGVLVKKRNEWRMVISVTLLQRSIAIEIDRECLRGI